VSVECLHLEQIDVKENFFHGDSMDGEIYMQKPQGYEIKENENLICILKKSSYGLRQEPRKRYLKFDKFIIEQGYCRCQYDHYVFKTIYNDNYIILLLFLHDMLVRKSNMLIVASNMQYIIFLKKNSLFICYERFR